MEKFISFKNWLNEQKEEKEPTYGCVMMGAKMPDWKDKHTSGIDPADVYIKQYDDSYGIEDKPHVTIVYGIHEDEIDPEVIMDIIENDMKPVTVMIKEISIFENDEYDVVKYDVPVTKQILKYRNMFLDNFENTQSFPDFHPHMTLAYVKTGKGKKYVSKLDEPFEITFNKGIYSFHDEEGETITKEHVYKDKKDIVDLTVNEEITKNKWEKVESDEYSNELISLVQNAYKKAAEGSFINTKKDTIEPDWLSIDFDEHPDLDATIFYRKARENETWGGIKIQGIGHDGSKEAIQIMLKKLKTLLNKKGVWIEASDAVEHILYKMDAPYVDNEKLAQKIFPGKNLKFLNDKGKYSRSVGENKKIKESIFGKPTLK